MNTEILPSLGEALRLWRSGERAQAVVAYRRALEARGQRYTRSSARSFFGARAGAIEEVEKQVPLLAG